MNFVINHPTYSRRGKEISEYKSYKTCEIIIGKSEIIQSADNASNTIPGQINIRDKYKFPKILYYDI